MKGDTHMPDVDELQEAKKFYTDTPQQTEGFFLKGSNSLDWGMKNRLSRIFNPSSGRTVMLAIDHGYFQGPTTGLERIDLNIFQSEDPVAMNQAVKAVVHDNESPAKAFELYNTLKNQK
jgi:hypothetical protein